MMGRGLGYLLIFSLVPTAFYSHRLAMEVAGLYFILFLLWEIFKKNGFYTKYDNANLDHQITHVWKGAKAEGKKPAMRKIYLASNDGSDFTVLIGFRLGTKFHCFGAMESQHGQAVMNTWMGKGPCDFCFMSTIPAKKIFTSHDDGYQSEQEIQTYWPHWYQQWPFYFFG